MENKQTDLIQNGTQIFKYIADQIMDNRNCVDSKLFKMLLKINLDEIESKKQEKSSEINISDEEMIRKYRKYVEYCQSFESNVLILEKIKDTMERKEKLIEKLKFYKENSKNFLNC